jgi:hypothetical protein
MKARIVALVVLAVACTACGAPKSYESVDRNKRTIFLSAVRTHGPEPVYSRTRWVLPPETLPAREETSSAASSDSPTLRPVFHLAVKGTTLEETARVMAAMARYSSYTAPSIAKNKISIENLGTIDELARIIERTAKVKVVVDHVNREVRFLAAHAEAPRLYSE